MLQPLALTLGEPAGMGPDITFAAWHRRSASDLQPFYILADPNFLRRCAAALAPDVPIVVTTPSAAASTFRDALPIVDIGITVSAKPGHPDATSAIAAITSIRHAVADVTSGCAAAMVTNPIAKSVLYQSGFDEHGSTEFRTEPYTAPGGRGRNPE